MICFYVVTFPNRKSEFMKHKAIVLAIESNHSQNISLLRKESRNLRKGQRRSKGHIKFSIFVTSCYPEFYRILIFTTESFLKGVNWIKLKNLAHNMTLNKNQTGYYKFIIYKYIRIGCWAMVQTQMIVSLDNWIVTPAEQPHAIWHGERQACHG